MPANETQPREAEHVCECGTVAGRSDNFCRHCGVLIGVHRHLEVDATYSGAAVVAVQWDGSEESQQQIRRWSGGRVTGWFDSVNFLEVNGIGGRSRVDVGDWVYCFQGAYGAAKTADLSFVTASEEGGA